MIPLPVSNEVRYYSGEVIKSFRNRHSEYVWQRRYAKRLPQDLHRRAYQKLVMLDAASRIEDLVVPPANRLEALKGSRKGQHSIRVNDQYRICFRWHGGDAYDVEIVDYHDE